MNISLPFEEKQIEAKENKEDKKEKETENYVGNSIGEVNSSAIISAQLKSSEGQILKEEKVVIPEKVEEGFQEKLIEILNIQNVRQEENKSLKPKISEIELINNDPLLKPYEIEISERIKHFQSWISNLNESELGILTFARSYKKFGINITENGITYREWAPNAKSLSLFGEFNNWNRNANVAKRNKYGVWELFLPNNPDGSLPIKHNTKLKACITLPNNSKIDRIPAWIQYSVQNPTTFLYDGVFWNPPEPYQWKFPNTPDYKSLRIYECHVGMSSEFGRVNSYRDFADYILPRIKNAHYNMIQIMAIMEHSYYASFGYHVTNFFAISSRSGTPEDFKYLVDKAHENGIVVIIDIIQSHASSNAYDGISQFDGTDYQYFHAGEKGFHKFWGSKLFNYKTWEVIRFLLSNVAFYLDVYKIDGFRYDAVTCMLFNNHGINYVFSGGLREYFGNNIDKDAVNYLMMANHVIHSINPKAITIAEDVSGFPGLCRPVLEGGIGFDYRLQMAIPDKWVKLVKTELDENWNMGNIIFNLANRRYNEKCVAYCESHDQAIVGDKTISMWLFDQSIYHGMAISTPASTVVDRGMSLHKMIKLITLALGGESYLNFMGNEFGHPEWIDFPRPGNNFSFHYCRRLWHLVDDLKLRYHLLANFDRDMNLMEEKYGILLSKDQFITLAHEVDKLIVFERGDLLFVFNFHPSKSFEHYRIGTKWSSDHRIVFHSDKGIYGGKERLQYGEENYFPYHKENWCNRPNYIKCYIPSRTAMVLIAKENEIKY